MKDLTYSLDFGMMGEFKQELRDGFIEACIHLVNRDYEALAKDFVTLGYVDYYFCIRTIISALGVVYEIILCFSLRIF